MTTFARLACVFACLLGLLLPVSHPAWPAGGAHSDAATNAGSVQAQPEPTPAEKMASRFPQPVRVGDLIGLAVLDWRDNTMGYVADVVRTRDGAIKLIVPYRRYFGWLASPGWGQRPVAVPLETVAMLGRQIAALDMPREDFEAAPAFAETGGSIKREEIVRIAITRR